MAGFEGVWLGLAPLLLLVATGLVIMVIDAFDDRADLALVTAGALFVAGGISAVMLWQGNIPELGEHVSRYVACDPLGLFFDVVICAGAGLSALLAGGYLREHRLERGEFYVLLIFSAFGAMVMARATDLLTLFIGLETMSLAVYCLVGFRRTSSRAAEAAVKYFLLGSFAAAILLFGSALLYGATGHTDFAGITESIANGTAIAPLLLVGAAMIVVGLAFKVSAVPFHQWTPDAYEGAVTPTTTFMSVAVKSAAFAVLVRVLAGVFGDPQSMTGGTGWLPVIVTLSVLTMIYGNLAAVAQSSVKRMLAYSSIAHAGYVLVGIAAIPKMGDVAISAVLYYLLAYTVSNVLAFGSLIWIGSRGKEAVSYADLAGVGRRHPWVAIPFVLGVLTLMGFPPTAGFFAKYYVFSAAVQSGGWMVALAVLGVLASAVGAYYYLKVVVYLFMRDPEEGDPIAVPMRSGYVLSAIVIAGYYVLKMGIFPARYLDFAVSAAQGLVG